MLDSLYAALTNPPTTGTGTHLYVLSVHTPHGREIIHVYHDPFCLTEALAIGRRFAAEHFGCFIDSLHTLYLGGFHVEQQDCD